MGCCPVHRFSRERLMNGKALTLQTIKARGPEKAEKSQRIKWLIPRENK